MKQKYEGKDLQGLVDLGREQGYLTFDQVNDFLPQGVASATDLRAILTSFEDMDIKVLDEVPSGDSDGDIEVEAKEEPDEDGRGGDACRFARRVVGSGPALSQGDGQLPSLVA